MKNFQVSQETYSKSRDQSWASKICYAGRTLSSPGLNQCFDSTVVQTRLQSQVGLNKKSFF